MERERERERCDGGKKTVCRGSVNRRMSLARAVIASYLRFLHLETVDSASQLPTPRARNESALSKAFMLLAHATATQAHFECVL
jgi:hypothetical protein